MDGADGLTERAGAQPEPATRPGFESRHTESDAAATQDALEWAALVVDIELSFGVDLPASKADPTFETMATLFRYLVRQRGADAAKVITMFEALRTMISSQFNLDPRSLQPNTRLRELKRSG